MHTMDQLPSQGEVSRSHAQTYRTPHTQHTKRRSSCIHTGCGTQLHGSWDPTWCKLVRPGARYCTECNLCRTLARAVTHHSQYAARSFTDGTKHRLHQHQRHLQVVLRQFSSTIYNNPTLLAREIHSTIRCIPAKQTAHSARNSLLLLLLLLLPLHATTGKGPRQPAACQPPHRASGVSALHISQRQHTHTRMLACLRWMQWRARSYRYRRLLRHSGGKAGTQQPREQPINPSCPSNNINASIEREHPAATPNPTPHADPRGAQVSLAGRRRLHGSQHSAQP
jgi:hypothetical protein